MCACMTVKQLKAELDQFDDDTPVVIGYPSGDYWGRTIAIEPDRVDLMVLLWSSYHEAWKVDDEEQPSPGAPHTLEAVVIR